MFAMALLGLAGGAGNAFAQTTTTVVTSQNNPSFIGQTVTLIATVSVTTAFVPGGSVQFFDGATLLGSSFVGTGSAIFTVSTLALGPHSITGVYSGDTHGNLGSTSAAITQVVTPASTSTVVTSSVNPSTFGRTVTFTATVANATGGIVAQPTGTVQFAVDGVAQGGPAPMTNGVATFTSGSLASGNRNITAVYSGDTNNLTSNGSLTQTVNPAVTATQSIAVASLTQNHVVTPFTPVTGGGGTTPLAYSVSPSLPTGLSLSPTTGAVTGNPSVTSAATAYTVTVTDFNGATASNTFSLIVNPAVTATQVISAAFVTQSHAVTPFTPVTGSGGTGSLAYSVSPSLPAGLSLSPTTGAVTGNPTVTSPATTYTVTVTDANGAIATNTFSLTVNGALTATQAIASSTLTQNQAATPFTPVTGSGGTPPLAYSVSPTLPTGLNMSGTTGAITGTPTVTSAATTYTVTVTDANSVTATATFALTVNLPAPSFSSITPASGPLAGGTSVTIAGTNFTGATAVTFGGTAATSFTVNNATSITAVTPAHAAGAVNVVVAAPGGSGTGTNAYTYVTALTLSSTPSASTHIGQNYSQANAAGGGTTPYTYAISGGSLPAGTTLNTSTGLISGTPTALGNFSYTVKVTDSSPAPQTATQTVSGSITSAVTTTSLSSSLNPSQVGQSVTFTATVTGAGTPTGSVTFMDGGAVIGTATLAGGAATFSTATLTLGSHTITASYGGSASFSASTSVALIQAVNIPADSIKLRAMQVLATVVVAQNSGQAISGAVDSAIADGFADGGSFMSPSGNGMHFNFTSDPEAQGAANSQDTISNRWSGLSPSNAGGNAGANAATGFARTQPPSRIDDAFASIDRNAMATKAPRMAEPKDWMLWGEIRGSGIDRWSTSTSPFTPAGTQTAASLYGSQVNALIGLTRKFNTSFLAGVFGGYETFDYRSDALQGRLKGEGWTTGSYVGWKLTPDIRLTAAAAYSGLTYNGSAGTANGNFDGDRWLLSGALTGNYHMQRFEIEPSATVYALWEHENAYTDSLGTQQADRNFFTGRVSGGAKLAYPIAWSSTITIAPYAGVYGDYYFNGDDAAALAAAGIAPLASTPILEGWSARVTGGFITRMANGSSMAFGAELGGIGSSTQIWTFRGKGSIPF